MAPFVSGATPTAAELAAYHDYNMGEYHDWYTSLVDQVNDALPQADVHLLPVASILSDLLSTTLSEIPVDALYVDDAPHGTETIYYLSPGDHRIEVRHVEQYGDSPLQMGLTRIGDLPTLDENADSPTSANHMQDLIAGLAANWDPAKADASVQALLEDEEIDNADLDDLV